MVSGEHSNATTYRQTADAFHSGDTAALASLIDEDVIWHRPAVTAFMLRGIAYPVGDLRAVRELRV
jgi:hypothetical protein